MLCGIETYSEAVDVILNIAGKSVRSSNTDQVMQCYTMRKEKVVKRAFSLRLT